MGIQHRELTSEEKNQILLFVESKIKKGCEAKLEVSWESHVVDVRPNVLYLGGEIMRAMNKFLFDRGLRVVRFVNNWNGEMITNFYVMEQSWYRVKYEHD